MIDKIPEIVLVKNKDGEVVGKPGNMFLEDIEHIIRSKPEWDSVKAAAKHIGSTLVVWISIDYHTTGEYGKKGSYEEVYDYPGEFYAIVNEVSNENS